MCFRDVSRYVPSPQWKNMYGYGGWTKAILTAAHCYCAGVKETIYLATAFTALLRLYRDWGGPMIPCDIP